MTTHSADLAIADVDYPSWAWRSTMGKRGNYVLERWTAWLRVEEKWRTAAARPFLHTDEWEARPFLRVGGREGKAQRLHAHGGRKHGSRNRDGKLICQVAIFERYESWYARLLFSPSWFAQLLEAISLVLLKLYGYQVVLPNSWRCSTSFTTRSNVLRKELVFFAFMYKALFSTFPKSLHPISLK